MANTVEIILKATDQASATLKQSGGELDKLKASLGSLINPATLAAAGVAAVGKFVVDSVKGVAEYNRTVKLLSENLSLTSEETSRIIQVADDFGISIDSVRTSLQFAAKNGFAPTIENLAKLSDHLKTVQDPTVRAAELTKIFGRNWSELTPLLNAGGDAIREGAAAISDGLIVTQQAIEQSEKLRIAEDGLSDSWTAIKNNVGNQVIPVLAEVASQMNTNLSITALWQKAIDIGALSQEEAVKVDLSRADATEYLTGIINTFNAEQLKEIEYAASLAEGIGKDTNELLKLTPATSDATTAQLSLNSSLDSASSLTAEYSKQLLYSKAAAGLTTDQALLLARSLGLVDESTITAMTELDKLRTSFNNGELSAEDFARAVANLNTKIQSLKDKQVFVDVVTRFVGEDKSRADAFWRKNRQHGGPVTGGMPYIVGEAGPELFVPSSSGQIVPNNQITNRVLNINVSPHYYRGSEPSLMDELAVIGAFSRA